MVPIYTFFVVQTGKKQEKHGVVVFLFPDFGPNLRKQVDKSERSVNIVLVR